MPDAILQRMWHLDDGAIKDLISFDSPVGFGGELYRTLSYPIPEIA